MKDFLVFGTNILHSFRLSFLYSLFVVVQSLLLEVHLFVFFSGEKYLKRTWKVLYTCLLNTSTNDNNNKPYTLEMRSPIVVDCRISVARTTPSNPCRRVMREVDVGASCGCLPALMTDRDGEQSQKQEKIAMSKVVTWVDLKIPILVFRFSANDLSTTTMSTSDEALTLDDFGKHVQTCLQGFPTKPAPLFKPWTGSHTIVDTDEMETEKVVIGMYRTTNEQWLDIPKEYTAEEYHQKVTEVANSIYYSLRGHAQTNYTWHVLLMGPVKSTHWLDSSRNRVVFDVTYKYCFVPVVQS
jgi:hypothetical protein